MTTIDLTVELGREVDPIAGRLRAGDGSWWPFTGYLGLMAALSGLLAGEHAARAPRQGIAAGPPDQRRH